ncbi:hypothetical protein [Pseudomonas protegens]|uniref:hypothetical protein n=1 Tax=Pseudomonas protegens TaxID=380021 RepID=UPI00223ADBBD|nr:hypothetical protein [Pseudomonas protegens]
MKSILANRCLRRQMQPQHFSNWIGVDYLVLCNEHIPLWVAKIEDIALSRQDDGLLKFRFSEIRDVWGKGCDPAYSSAYELFRSDQHNPKLTTFEDDAFFTIGEPLPFLDNPDFSGPLTIKRAAARLSETYGVEPGQVEIIIRHQPSITKAS